MLVIVVIVIGCGSSKEKLEKANTNKCQYFLYQMKNYWKKDSLGNNGFRFLAGEKLQDLNCSFIGAEWKALEEYFGKPNKEFILGQKERKRYKLTDYGHPSTPGQRYLEFILSDEKKVEKVNFRTVDG